MDQQPPDDCQGQPKTTMGSEAQVARCRCCDRNNVPVGEMAIFSWKPMFRMYTGICMACYSNEAKMEAYQADIELGPSKPQNNHAQHRD